MACFIDKYLNKPVSTLTEFAANVARFLQHLILARRLGGQRVAGDLVNYFT